MDTDLIVFAITLIGSAIMIAFWVNVIRLIVVIFRTLLGYPPKEKNVMSSNESWGLGWSDSWGSWDYGGGWDGGYGGDCGGGDGGGDCGGGGDGGCGGDG